MSRKPQDQEMSGTLLDAVRNMGRDLGTLSSTSGLLGVLSVAVGLVLFVTVSDVRLFGYILLGFGLVLLIMALVTSRRKVAESVTGRRGRYGTNTVLMITAFIAIVAILNFVAFDNPVRLDVTSTKQFSLAPRSVEIIENLNQEVEALAFFDKNDLAQEAALEVVDNTLHEFDVRSDLFSYEVVNLDVEPAKARDYGVNQHGQVAFVGKESGAFEVVFGAFLDPGDPVANQPDAYVANPLVEQDFVTPILVVTGEEEKSVYFLIGHGERNPASHTEGSGYFLAAESLRSESYKIQTLDLQNQKIVDRQSGEEEGVEEDPNEVSPSLIVIAGPQKNLLPNEADALNTYLKDGGRMLLLLDPETPDSFRDFLSGWGLKLGSGNIIDQEDFVGEQRTPFISQHNPDIELTRVLGRTFYPGVTSLTPSFERVTSSEGDSSSLPSEQDCVRGWAFSGLQGLIPCYQIPTFQVDGQESALMVPIVLALTSGGSWLIEESGRTNPNEDTDTAGPFVPLALVYAFGPLGEEIVISEEGLEPASLIVVGDSDFATNEHFNTASNGDLFLNSANQLVGDVSLINIRPKLVPRRELLATPQEFDVIRYTSWFLLPALMGAVGVLVWWRRR